jgi:2-oxoglutarate/2-oxoacid ferredoxin oxidoreductase subunit alpha
MGREDVSIVLCGEAGQGIQTVENLLTPILNLSGYNVFSTKEYMSRIRGGSNSTEIRVSSRRVRAYVDRIDLLIPLDKDAIPHLGGRITADTVIVGEKDALSTDRKVIDAPFSKAAAEVGGPIYANTVAVGLISRLFSVDTAISEAYVRRHFAKKPSDVAENNVQALRRGYAIGGDVASSGKIAYDIGKDPAVAGEILIKGADAVGLGALAGGCDFISAYPMTPSTGQFTFLAQHARDFGIVAEQAEDEISAINMALGAWYAGARAFVTTSGGGFALMVEGVSLSGMLETPVVINLSMRPAPATGLPTRTEQGDLEFALYSGHGEFPRIILAPGTVEEAFRLTAKAFNLADRHQSPVFVLTDQYLVDSYHNLQSLESSGMTVERHVVETQPGYKRYAITADGISPRGIPGWGSGLVMVDSDEHDEDGHITEDLRLRTRMVDKRLAKLKAMEAEAIPPSLTGPQDFRNLVICWGSTYPVVREAMESSELGGTAILHFSQVYPLHPDAIKTLMRAKKTVIVENNATSQFGKVLRTYTGFTATERVLKYDGMPFSVEEVAGRLREALG